VRTAAIATVGDGGADELVLAALRSAAGGVVVLLATKN